MSLKITSACINCGACEPECPNTAIYAPKVPWRFGDGTKLEGDLEFGDDKLPADQILDALSQKFFYIVPDKCTECVGFHDEPQCNVACPISNCCVLDELIAETEDELLEKKKWLHQEDVAAAS